MPKKSSDAARELSRRGAAKGGHARANVLTADERREIAQKAVRVRWEKAGKLYDEPPVDREAIEPSPSNTDADLPYSLLRGTLPIGNVAIECHVLSDYRRVITQREVVRVLTSSAQGRQAGNLDRYVEANPLTPASYLEGKVIPFRLPGTQFTANGYEATLLIEICEMYLEARDQELLRTNQKQLARTAEIVVRACAKVGIIALVDEVTGFQQYRNRQDLQLKLQAFIADEMQDWARMFPDEFWLELARLEGIRYSPRSRPLRWGKYVMAFVYDAIDGDVGRELRRINPDPHYRQNHHQWLRKYGRDRVNNQLQRVITIMKLCTNMDDFHRKFDYVFKKAALQPSFWDAGLIA